jgi:hypothetical protein
MNIQSSCAASLGAILCLIIMVAAPAHAASAPPQSDARIFLVQPVVHSGLVNDQYVVDGFDGGGRYTTDVRLDATGDEVVPVRGASNEQKSEEESILDIALMLFFAAGMFAYPLIRKQRALLHTSVLTTYV